MSKLIVVVHGRSASTLVLRMLYSTGVFELWGEPPKGECPAFRNKPENWGREAVRREWEKLGAEGRVLAKLPAFAFFLDNLLPLSPDVIVLERSVVDIVKSYAALGNVEQVTRLHSLFGVDRLAEEEYAKLGGVVRHDDPYHKIAVVYAWSHRKVHRDLEGYSRALFIHYMNLMSSPEEVFTRFEEFLGLEPGRHRQKWRVLMGERHQSTGRPCGLGYQKPLRTTIPDESMRRICDAVWRFGYF